MSAVLVDNSYMLKHAHLKKKYGKAIKCENPKCFYPRRNANRRWTKEPKLFHWALRRGHEYTSNREDYVMLCPSCHKLYDTGKELQYYPPLNSVKLKPNDKSAIRAAYKRGASQRTIAKQYNVSQTLISRIINSK